MYDVIIIGAGPAGISAAIYTKRANLNVLVLHYGESQLEKAEKIDNYYGFENGITGNELFEKGIKQAQNLGIEVLNKQIIDIEQTEDLVFNVKSVDESFSTKSIIIATGNKKTKPAIKGIEEFEGKGISYCAICDGFFYKNKDVVVIGNGEFAINEAEHLSSIANSVTILTNGLEKPNQNKYIVNDKRIREIKGIDKVEQIEFEDGSTINVSGIFIALGIAGGNDFAKKLGVMTENNSIKVNENMETNVEGLFACGDLTGGLLQVNKCAYEGAKAGLQAAKYIKSKK